MDQKSQLPQGITREEIMRIANSPAGQQLVRLLQQRGGDQLQNAVDKASRGNFEDAKNTLSDMLNTPEIQAMLRQLGGKP